MFFVFKLSQLLILPTIITFVLLFFGYIGKSRIFYSLGLLSFYLFSIAPVSDALIRPLEKPYENVNAEEPCLSEVGVLLLGGYEEDISRSVPAVELSAKCGKKFHLIVSGIDPFLPGSKEAEEVKNLLIKEGMEANAISLEEKSRTTGESARNLAESLGEKPFYLITSAYHMTRSVHLFRARGANPIPFPTPFEPPRGFSVLSFIPSSYKLSQSDKALHEYAGLLFCKANDFWHKRRTGTK